jgi:hypothetical protein
MTLICNERYRLNLDLHRNENIVPIQGYKNRLNRSISVTIITYLLTSLVKI